MDSSSEPTSSNAKHTRHVADVVHTGILLQNSVKFYCNVYSDGALRCFLHDPIDDDSIDSSYTYSVLDIKNTNPSLFEFTIKNLKFYAHDPEAYNRWHDVVKRFSDEEAIAKAEAEMGNADTAGADMAEEILAGADMAKEILAGVDMAEADVAEENLAEADMAEEILAGVDMAEADVAEENLAEADMAEEILAGANLASDLFGFNSDATLNDFAFVDALGSGSFAKVMLVRHRSSRQVHAIKMIAKGVPEDGGNDPITESRIMFIYNHHFLTRMAYTFETVDHYCFVMDYEIGGDLKWHLREAVRSGQKGFGLTRTRFYAAEIACGIGYLHEQRVVYRDLKLENILLDREGHVKIADFGFCKDNVSFGQPTRTFCGTFEYMAPEVVALHTDPDGADGYDGAVDWWALGIIIYEMLCGFPPFDGETLGDLFQNISIAPLAFEIDFPISPRSSIERLLTKEPTMRLGYGLGDFGDVKNDPFFGSINWDALTSRNTPPQFTPDIFDDIDTKYFDLNFLNQKDPELESIFAQFSFYEQKKTSNL